MADSLVLHEPFRSLWQGKNPFDEVEKISGRIYRTVETRQTLRFKIGQDSFFLKLHHGTKFKEIVKSLIRLRMPVLGSEREWMAINHLTESGVDTLDCVAYGVQSGNPLVRKSFLITKDIGNNSDVRSFLNYQLPSPVVKRLIIRRVASLVRKMHLSGINHRDCYLGHFLLHLPLDAEKATEQDLKISIIDLHRAQIRDAVPKRWRDKDLTGLLFSARKLVNFSYRDIFRFMKAYFQLPLREILRQEKSLIDSAPRRVVRMARHQVKLKKVRNKA